MKKHSSSPNDDHLDSSSTCSDTSSLFKPAPPPRNNQQLHQHKRARQRHQHAQLTPSAPQPPPPESQGRASRIRLENSRLKLQRQGSIIKKIIRRHAAEVAEIDRWWKNEEGMYRTCGFSALNSSTSVPSASPSQQWYGMMRQVLYSYDIGYDGCGMRVRFSAKKVDVQQHYLM